MIVIKPYAEIIDVGEMDPLKKIELVGRICYKSEGKITEESAPAFVSGLIKRGHEAMLEHASFCFESGEAAWMMMRLLPKNFIRSTFRCTKHEQSLISGNVRAWREVFKLLHEKDKIPPIFECFIKEHPTLFPEFQDYPFSPMLDSYERIKLVKPDEMTLEEKLMHCDVSVRFVVDRGISHEIVRHRVASYAQESTRYCNYSKDGFGGQITYIEPNYLTPDTVGYTVWADAMEDCERAYFCLLADGLTPQEARAVLPTSLKTELVMTANLAEWRHFFALRALNATGKAHPQMLEVTVPLLEEFRRRFGGLFDGLSSVRDQRSGGGINA